jgi:hypothetical protein
MVSPMSHRVAAAARKVTVGPAGGPTYKIPAGFKITSTGDGPYDLKLTLEFSEEERRHTLREVTFTSTDGGEPVRMSQIMRVAIAELIERTLEEHVLGEAGWPGVVAAQDADLDQERVDALVYLLSVALGGQRPSATVAVARGLSPASGPKRVSIARKAGLIPATEPGKPSAGLGSFDKAASGARTPGRRRRRSGAT